MAVVEDGGGEERRKGGKEEKGESGCGGERGVTVDSWGKQK